MRIGSGAGVRCFVWPPIASITAWIMQRVDFFLYKRGNESAVVSTTARCYESASCLILKTWPPTNSCTKLIQGACSDADIPKYIRLPHPWPDHPKFASGAPATHVLNSHHSKINYFALMMNILLQKSK